MSEDYKARGNALFKYAYSTLLPNVRPTPSELIYLSTGRDGKYEQAIEEYTKGIEADPEVFAAHTLAVLFVRQSHQHPRPIESCAVFKSIWRFCKGIKCHFNLCTTQLNFGVVLCPRVALFMRSLSLANLPSLGLQLKNFKKALEDAESCVSLKRVCGKYYGRQGDALYGLGR